MKKWIVVGLGNPGAQYTFTRHNIGFLVIDELAKRYAISLKSNRTLFGDLGSFKSSDFEVRFVKPMTFMNESGKCVQAVLNYYNHSLDDLIVITDDVVLPYGVIRSRSKGSSGGHNGLKSIARFLHSDAFIRLRLGVKGIGSDRIPMRDYVLNRFTESEQGDLPLFIDEAAAFIENIIRQLSQPDPVYREEIVHQSKTIIEQEKII